MIDMIQEDGPTDHINSEELNHPFTAFIIESNPIIAFQF